MTRGSQSGKNSSDVEPAVAPCLDIISELPDYILCHILSFLPTKESVATSILAKRWRFLWTQVMSIDFFFDFDGKTSEVRAFPEIFNRYLLLNTSRCIRTFRLHFEAPPLDNWHGEDQLETWISKAVERNVQVLDLFFDQIFDLPRCLFVSKTLVEFTLHLYSSIISVGDVCLPNLKKLNLYCVTFEDDETLPKLISGCLVLEQLTVHEAYSSIDISSPTLKHLTLYSSEYFDWDGENEIMLKLDTPALQYLNLEDNFSGRISSQNMSSIVEAEVLLNIPHLCSIFEFIERLSMVKCLELSCLLEMELLDPLFAASTTKFRNLVKLAVDADWRFLTKFLESADKLEILIIDRVNGDDDNLKCWREPGKVPECLLSCLREVTIHQFGCGESDFKMLRYILKNAKFLNKMKIYFRGHRYSLAKSNARREISHFRRGSEACEVDCID